MTGVQTCALPIYSFDLLKDTDVPELQPDYLKDQMSEATDKIKDAGKEIVKNQIGRASCRERV